MLLLLLVTSLVVGNYFFESPIVRAMSYFVLGVILSSNALKGLKIKSPLASYLLIALFLLYLLIGATWVLQLPTSILSELIKISIVSLLIFLASCCEPRDSSRRLITALGKRSFCIYAFHYPILLAFNYLLAPTTGFQFLIYLICCLTGTAVVSECAYRLVDKPSMKYSASIFNTNEATK